MIFPGVICVMAVFLLLSRMAVWMQFGAFPFHCFCFLCWRQAVCLQFASGICASVTEGAPGKRHQPVGGGEELGKGGCREDPGHCGCLQG